MTAAPDLLMQGGLRQFENYAGALTPQQKAAVDAWIPRLRSGERAKCWLGPASPMGVDVQIVDVMRSGNQRGSLISFYAAGIGVMFLLFSMVGARRRRAARRGGVGHARAIALHQYRHDRDAAGQVGVPVVRRFRPTDRHVPVGTRWLSACRCSPTCRALP